MHVHFLTSWQERCGIAEYSRRLLAALPADVEPEVVPTSLTGCDRETYARLGKALNPGGLTHIQHSYVFFGGMHPLRSGWRSFARHLRCPTVVTVHELDLQATGAYGLPGGVEVFYKRVFNRQVFRHPAIRRWIVHSGDLRHGLVGLGVPETRILYRPMPVPEPPDQPVDPEPLRRELGLEGKRVLVILGYLARRKGYDLALQALQHLSPEVVVLAAGGEHAADATGTADRLMAEARAAGVANRFQVTGYLSEVQLEQAVGLADLVLAPFREMSGSSSLSFALARGKPVVASDLPENRALGSCVRLFSAGHPGALAAAVADLLAEPEARTVLAREAVEYARRHSYAALAAETAEVYRELAAENRSESKCE
jgi:glycosyltransferase involved in cell wall biosynthesis